MKVYKKDKAIMINSCDIDYLIIDENGQIQLKPMYKFLSDCEKNSINSETEIIFEDIDDDLKNGLSIFLKDILSKAFSTNVVSN